MDERENLAVENGGWRSRGSPSPPSSPQGARVKEGAAERGRKVAVGSCAHSGTFLSFDPPWKAPTRRAVPEATPDEVLDVPEVTPLTVGDHIDEAAWLAGGPEWVA